MRRATLLPLLVPSFLLWLASALAARSAPVQTSQVPRPVPGGGRDVEPPRSGPDVPVRFGILGDFGTTDPESFEVAALVRSLAPRFLITLGDNNYPDGEAETIDENIGQHYHEFIHPYVGSYGEGATVNRFFPSLGNHDWNTTDAQPYLDYFELPGNERYYDFRRGPLHFFALDSDPEEPDGIERDSIQAAWLQAALAASDAPYKIVYMHHAPYCSSSNHGTTGDLQWPYKQWGATIVFAGHDHLYERSSIGGLTYVVNGLGGRDTYDFEAEPIGGSQLRFNAEHGAMLAVADERFARFRFLTSNGSVQDDFVLPSGAGLDPGVVTFVPEDAEWKYLDTGVDPGPQWRGFAFDDSAWASGRAQLGYGEGDETTVVSYGGITSNRHVTTWFRRSFSVTNPFEIESLQLRLLVDDGAVVYLNGAELVRVRLPAGPIDATQLASTGASGDVERTFYPYQFGSELLLDVQPGQLARGRNVLAVEVHQASRSSNDVSFAAELVGSAKGKRLIPRSATWRYRDGNTPPTAWKEPGFDDSAWSSGRAQLGYGEGDEATTLATGGTTTWYRTTFTVEDADAVRWLSCRLLRDDGAMIHLNGKEALRLNLPLGEVLAVTLAPFNVSAQQEGRYEEFSLDPRQLVDGLNTIAVEIHQSNAGNPDLSFDLELVAH